MTCVPLSRAPAARRPRASGDSRRAARCVASKAAGTGRASRTATLWGMAVACVLLGSWTAASAQQGNRDYYQPRVTKDDKQLLWNVENYHIGPGVTKMQAGNFRSALGDIEFVLRYYPNHPRGLALISELCDVKWKNSRCDSDRWFRAAIEINPLAPRTFVVYGVHLQRTNRQEDAVRSYERAIRLDPASRDAHYNLAMILFDRKEYDSANRHAQLAYALGMPYPALRDRLTRSGHWRPLDDDELKRELAPRSGAVAASPPN